MTTSRSLVPRVSYAQNGEDILLDRVFGDLVGTFIDLGACHPHWDSNTFFFYERGWRGTSIEPNLKLINAFETHRPEDRNLNVAVSDHDGELTFFDVVENIGLSTLDRDVAQEHRRNGFEVSERQVEVRSVASLIAEFAIPEPEFLSLDVEAHEGPVLAGIPLSSWRPKVLVIESTLPRTSIPCHQGWEQRIIEHGYIFAAFNGVNRFYLRDDLRDKLELFRNPVNAVDNFQRSDLVNMRTELEAVVDALRRSHAETEYERNRFVASKAAWEWGVHQSQLAQTAWQRETEQFENYRLTFEQQLKNFGGERAELHRMHDDLTREVDRLNQVVSLIESERSTWQMARANLVHEVEATQRQVEETQRHLRPYAMIDRFGVVSSGYGLARRIKNKLASEMEL